MRAAAYAEAGIGQTRAVGLQHGTALGLTRLAEVESAGGDLAGARALFDEALAACRGEEMLGLAASIRARCAVVDFRSGLEIDAHRLTAEVLPALRAEGWTRVAANLLLVLGERARTRYRYEESELLLSEARRRYETSDRRGEGLAYLGQGRLALDRGDYERGATFFREALKRMREVGDPGGLAAALEARAGLDAILGHTERALLLAGAAVTLRSTARIPPTNRMAATRTWCSNCVLAPTTTKR